MTAHPQFLGTITMVFPNSKDGRDRGGRPWTFIVAAHRGTLYLTCDDWQNGEQDYLPPEEVWPIVEHLTTQRSLDVAVMLYEPPDLPILIYPFLVAHKLSESIQQYSEVTNNEKNLSSAIYMFGHVD